MTLVHDPIYIQGVGQDHVQYAPSSVEHLPLSTISTETIELTTFSMHARLLLIHVGRKSKINFIAIYWKHF